MVLIRIFLMDCVVLMCHSYILFGEVSVYIMYAYVCMYMYVFNIYVHIYIIF